MPSIRSVAVFCGASTGNAAHFAVAARDLGRGIAEAGLRLIYGGGRVGLMGEVADAAVRAGGTVIGVIPDFLKQREVAHDDISELIVTSDMHTRKRQMFELSDAFISFAGGLGTMDETFEILTWRQLGLHDKPVLICDVAGAAGPLLATIEGAIAMGFARPETRDLYDVRDGVPAALDWLRSRDVPGGATPLRGD